MYESISKNNELENEVSSDMSYFWYSDDDCPHDRWVNSICAQAEVNLLCTPVLGFRWQVQGTVGMKVMEAAIQKECYKLWIRNIRICIYHQEVFLLRGKCLAKEESQNFPKLCLRFTFALIFSSFRQCFMYTASIPKPCAEVWITWYAEMTST